MGCSFRSIRPTRRNILFPVSRPTHFFSKKAKKKKKKRRGFQMASCSYALFFATPVLLTKDGRGLVIVRRPTDLQLRETVGIPETRYFFWLALARINSSSIFGRRVLFLAAKTGTPFHFFLLKVEWGAIFGPFRFWHDKTAPTKFIAESALY